MSIKSTIEAIHQINSNKCNIYMGDGLFIPYRINLTNTVSNKEIVDFEKEIDVKLPEDYKEFLSYSNGITFLESGDFQLFNLNVIKSIAECMDYKKGVFIIGNLLEDYILINGTEISSNRYIYVGSSMEYDKFVKLDCNFETFLERLLLCQLQKYWLWNLDLKHYNFSK